MMDNIPSLSTATELPCEAFALATKALDLFDEMKSRRNDGYVSLIPSGHRTSLCGLCFTNKCFGPFLET
jgi:hypothetical protein